MSENVVNRRDAAWPVTATCREREHDYKHMHKDKSNYTKFRGGENDNNYAVKVT